MPAKPNRVESLSAAHYLLQTEHYLREWGESLTFQFGRDVPELHVHGCTPEQLDTARVGWPDAEAHEDGDGILRWVETTLYGIEVTLYRR